jgi:hypothetical protein
MKKDKFLQMRITDKERQEMKKVAKKKGFDTVASYLMWLFRQDKEK